MVRAGTTLPEQKATTELNLASPNCCLRSYADLPRAWQRTYPCEDVGAVGFVMVCFTRYSSALDCEDKLLVYWLDNAVYDMQLQQAL